ncbi:MAG: PorT family protein [Chitinophagaceae bacterium]|nr:PorT family protein [Chitinophagaceae bacterium]
MKKTYTIIAALISLNLVHAQEKLAFIAGPQITNAYYYIPQPNLGKAKQETSMKYGFQAGMNGKFSLEGRFYFVPAAFYSLKGFKVTLTKPSYPPDSAAIDNDVMVHTFELAPMFQLNFSNKPAHFFFRIGPSIDVQITGRERFHLSGGGSVSRKMKFSFADYGYAGANILLHLGYKTKSGFIVYAHYTHGVGSIVNTDGGPKIFHRAAGISLGKFFTSRKEEDVIRRIRTGY